MAAIHKTAIILFETADAGIKPPGEILYNLRDHEGDVGKFETARNAYLDRYGIDLRDQKRRLTTSSKTLCNGLILVKGL